MKRGTVTKFDRWCEWVWMTGHWMRHEYGYDWTPPYYETRGGLVIFVSGHWRREGTYWAPHGDWDYETASIEGSSYLKLPQPLAWLTGNIGVHHVHHISPKIPNYKLKKCHDENPLFHGVTVVTLRRRVKRQQPQGVHAQVLQILELLRKSGEIAYAIVVAIGKGLDVELINNCILEPQRIGIKYRICFDRGHDVHRSTVMPDNERARPDRHPA